MSNFSVLYNAEMTETMATIYALSPFNGIKVLCPEEIREQASEDFLQRFTEKWNAALKKVEKEMNDSADIARENFPVDIILTDDGFFISVDSLDIRYGYGDYYMPCYGPDAFFDTMEEMQDKYSELEPTGYVIYVSSDVHGGEWTDWGFGDVEEYVGNAFAKMLHSAVNSHRNWETDEPYFWDMLASELAQHEDYFDTIQCLYVYEAWMDKESLEDTVKKIRKFAKENGFEEDGNFAH